MLRLSTYGILVCAIVALLACSEKPTTSKPNVETEIYQAGGCQRQVFNKAAAGEDSCFIPQFAEDLLIDFCVTANCCPDTNRFEATSLVKSDTIIIMVQDTAVALCLCDCPYRIHAEFRNLARSSYLVLCYYDSTLIYRNWVVKES